MGTPLRKKGLGRSLAVVLVGDSSVFGRPKALQFPGMGVGVPDGPQARALKKHNPAERRRSPRGGQRARSGKLGCERAFAEKNDIVHGSLLGPLVGRSGGEPDRLGPTVARPANADSGPGCCGDHPDAARSHNRTATRIAVHLLL